MGAVGKRRLRGMDVFEEHHLGHITKRRKCAAKCDVFSDRHPRWRDLGRFQH
jgi:hypothetical protein